MSGGLQHVGDGDVERCAFCGVPAAGPCASCKRSVCGDCCVLTEGGVQLWAICLQCDRKGGRSLAPAWRRAALWIAGVFLVLIAFALLSVLLVR